MPQTQMGPVNTMFVNSIKATSDMGGNDTDLTTPVNYTSIQSLDAALTAANGTYYTQARLDTMTVNDKVWALRSIQDKTSISNYQPTSTA